MIRHGVINPLDYLRRHRALVIPMGLRGLWIKRTGLVLVLSLIGCPRIFRPMSMAFRSLMVRRFMNMPIRAKVSIPIGTQLYSISAARK